ncbi:MAG: hypothetical protein WDW38_011029 [Sanguina aurantia]
MDPAAAAEPEAVMEDDEDLAAMAAVEAELLAMADQESGAPGPPSPQRGDDDVEQAMAELAGMIDVQAGVEMEDAGQPDQHGDSSGPGDQAAGFAQPAGVDHQLSVEADLPTVDQEEEDASELEVKAPSPCKPAPKTTGLRVATSVKQTAVSAPATTIPASAILVPADCGTDSAAVPSQVASKKRPGLVVARAAAPKAIKITDSDVKVQAAVSVSSGAVTAGKKVSLPATNATLPAVTTAARKPAGAVLKLSNKPLTTDAAAPPLAALTNPGYTKDTPQGAGDETVSDTLPLKKPLAKTAASAKLEAKKETAAKPAAVTTKATGPAGVTPKPPGAVTQPASKAGTSPAVDNSVSDPALRAAAKIMPDSTPAVKPAVKPPVQQASKPAVGPAAKPPGETVAKPAAKPAVKPAAKPAVKPAVKEVNDEQEVDGAVAVKKKSRERAAGPALQSAYMIFATQQRPVIKEANPDASFGDLGKLMGEAWKELSDEDKQLYKDQAEELKAAAAEEKAALGDAAFAEKYAKKAKKCDKENIAPGPKKAAKKQGKTQADETGDTEDVQADTMQAEPKARKTPGRKSGGGKRKRGAVLAPVEAEAAPVDGDEEDDEDRENVDWIANPATAIITHTFDGYYLVARQGLDHTNYGAVPVKSAKRLRLDPDAADMANFPLSLKQLEEFESGQRMFANAVKEHTEGGELDLQTLPDFSPLEMCRVLGALREDNNILDRASSKKHNKKDVFISVPLLSLSEVVQRFVNIERAENKGLADRLAAAEADIALLRAQLEQPGEEEGVAAE